MGERAVGLILAALDVDIDNGAVWNRWYDLEHLAPNLALPDVVTGHRYVAPPDLHDCRVTTGDDSVWGRGRSTYLTWYATSVDPAAAIATMSTRRDELEAAGRMDRAGARVVRSGDALTLLSTASDPSLGLDEHDLVHVGHVGLRLVIDCEERVASLGPGIAASLRFGSAFAPGRFAELQLLADDPRSVLDQLRSGEGGRPVEVDAAFDRIEPLRYPFLAAIENSSLPQRVDED
ncbi:MAG TPA: hypothetical protein DEA70_06595 [Acidimicrobiaceae bacterium]|nr:hypothetical protein [Acidimicrobiaceae bacterium]